MDSDFYILDGFYTRNVFDLQPNKELDKEKTRDETKSPRTKGKRTFHKVVAQCSLEIIQDRQKEAAENGVDLNEVPDNASIHSDSSLRVDTFFRFPCSCMLRYSNITNIILEFLLSSLLHDYLSPKQSNTHTSSKHQCCSCVAARAFDCSLVACCLMHVYIVNSY